MLRENLHKEHPGLRSQTGIPVTEGGGAKMTRVVRQRCLTHLISWRHRPGLRSLRDY